MECGRDKVIYCIGSSDRNDTHAAVVVAGVEVLHMLHETLNTAHTAQGGAKKAFWTK